MLSTIKKHPVLFAMLLYVCASLGAMVVSLTKGEIGHDGPVQSRVAGRDTQGNFARPEVDRALDISVQK